MQLRRWSGNPILARGDIPDLPGRLSDPSSVFNPGAAIAGSLYRLLARVQSRGRETFLVVAESSDGHAFRVRPEIVQLRGLERLRETVYHVYDPRVTRLEDGFYIVLALDTDHGCQLGLARTADFTGFEFLDLISTGDERNGVLFPEKVGGRYLLLRRPNRPQPGRGVSSGAVIELAESTDLLRWRAAGDVMAGRAHYWDELIGSGPPPIKTAAGWLHIYHGIATHFHGANIYQAGVALLDRDDPTRVLARSRNNILEPREMYELVGQVPNVVFPSGVIVEGGDEHGMAAPDSRVLLYYGAADTCIGLAESTVGELLAACRD
jgi:beta-1,4-mannooligosaccharide/beta-1,4-mannosyl-N-acetylglucosamine phosphorylase